MYGILLFYLYLVYYVSHDEWWVSSVQWELFYVALVDTGGSVQLCDVSSDGGCRIPLSRVLSQRQRRRHRLRRSTLSLSCPWTLVKVMMHFCVLEQRWRWQISKCLVFERVEINGMLCICLVLEGHSRSHHLSSLKVAIRSSVNDRVSVLCLYR